MSIARLSLKQTEENESLSRKLLLTYLTQISFAFFKHEKPQTLKGVILKYLEKSGLGTINIKKTKMVLNDPFKLLKEISVITNGLSSYKVEINSIKVT